MRNIFCNTTRNTWNVLRYATRWQLLKGLWVFTVALSAFIVFGLLLDNHWVAGLASFIIGFLSIGRIFETEGSGEKE